MEQERRIKQSPLKYAKQHDKQIEATKALNPIRCLFWGNRTGKTEWGGQEASRFALADHPYRDIIAPNEGWVCCPSFDLQTDSVQKKLEKYLGTNDIKKVDYLRGNIWKNVRLKNGSLMTFKTYEQGREKFQSAGKRWIWFDEEPPSDIYEECVVRQEAGIPLDIWITMTPVNGMTWIYDEIYIDTGNPLYFCSDAEWNDNIWLGEDQKKIMRQTLEKRGERIEVREKGRFVARVGLVCNWWRREKNIRKYSEFSSDWSYYEVFDGGWTDPATWLLIAIDTIGDIHILDGFSKKEMLTTEIKQLRNSKVMGLNIRSGVSDNDNPRLVEELRPDINLEPIAKQSSSSKSWYEVMAEAMASYGKVQKETDMPRLYINKDLGWLISQIENLKWLEVDKKQGLEIKPKWDDHRRYGHHFDGVFCIAYFITSFQGMNTNIEYVDSGGVNPYIEGIG